MKKKKKIRKVKEKISGCFYQEWGTYSPTTLVACGFKDYKDLIEFMSTKDDKEWLEAMRNKPEEFDADHFSVWTHEKRRYSLLWLKSWKSDQYHYKVLAHELLHGVSFMMSDFMDCIKENEAFAYQHTYLFDEIANKLNANF